MGSARIAFSPLGKVAYDQTLYLRESQPFRFSIGLNGYLQRVVPVHTVVDTMTGQTVTVQDPERHNRTVGADLAIFVERFSFLGEIDYRFQRIVGGGSARAFGAYAQMGYYIPRLRLEVSTRIGFVDPSRGVPENTVHIYEGALTGYVHGNHAKIALRYLYADAGSALSGLYVGRQHRLTLATQIFF
jgi:hypothetical protein